MRSVLKIGLYRAGAQSSPSFAARPPAVYCHSGCVMSSPVAAWVLKAAVIKVSSDAAAAAAPHHRINVYVICVSAYWTCM